MAWTQDDIDTLKSSIASGAMTVTYSDGSSASFRNLNEMKAILAMMTAEVNPVSAPTKVIRTMPRSGY